MKLLAAVVGAFALATTFAATEQTVECVDFSVGAGTGCAWMCNYCATTLGTDNYYFTTDVCTYQEGVGCVGSPQAGVTYRCCAAAAEEEEELIAEDADADADADDDGWEACDDDEDIVFEDESVYLVSVKLTATKLA
jgi:hypothetical protein